LRVTFGAPNRRTLVIFLGSRESFVFAWGARRRASACATALLSRHHAGFSARISCLFWWLFSSIAHDVIASALLAALSRSYSTGGFSILGVWHSIFGCFRSSRSSCRRSIASRSRGSKDWRVYSSCDWLWAVAHSAGTNSESDWYKVRTNKCASETQARALLRFVILDHGSQANGGSGQHLHQVRHGESATSKSSSAASNTSASKRNLTVREFRRCNPARRDLGF